MRPLIIRVKQSFALTLKASKNMKARCNNCGKWFPISRELNNLIEEGIISPLDINLCEQCAEIEQDTAEYEYILNDLEA
jgi:hypothetical protein